MADKPTPWWKRAHEVISMLRSFEWVVVWVVAAGGAVSGATWFMSSVIDLPLAWRIGITIVFGIVATIVSLGGLFILAAAETRRRSIPPPFPPPGPSPEAGTVASATLGAAPASPPVPKVELVTLPSEIRAGREIIPRSPEVLWAQFEGRTDDQAQLLIARDIGNWMALRGPLRDVSGGTAFFQSAALPSMKLIFMRFRDERAREQLGGTIQVTRSRCLVSLHGFSQCRWSSTTASC